MISAVFRLHSYIVVSIELAHSANDFIMVWKIAEVHLVYGALVLKFRGDRLQNFLRNDSQAFAVDLPITSV